MGKKVVDDLKDQIKELEKILEDKKKRNEIEIAAASKAVKEEEEKMNVLKEQYEKQQVEASKLPTKDINELKKKADESDKIVRYLKKENSRLKSETEQLDEDLAKMKETNSRLIEANASAGASLETLNKQAKVLKDHNKKLENSIDEFKKANKKLEHDLKGRKAYYDAEMKVRSDYENVMEKIVKMMEE